jgi:hypothetical protein
MNYTRPQSSVIATECLKHSSEPSAPVISQMHIPVAFPGEEDATKPACRPPCPVSLSVVTAEVLGRREQLTVAAVIIAA